MTTAESLRGTLGIGEDGAFRIHFERLLRHTPERVWQWITTPQKLEQWLPGCTIDARVGGAVRFDFGEEGAATGSVSECSAPGASGVLVHSWVWEGIPDSRVTWTLDPDASGTRLTLIHSEVLAEPARDFAIGWHVIIDSLELDLSGGDAGSAWNEMETIAALYTSTE